MKTPTAKRDLPVAILLGFLVWVGALADSPYKSFWLDEAYGLQVSVRHPSFWSLLWEGAPGQGSPHPLYYLLEKLLYLPWEPAPQEYWHLFFFMRILCSLYWALTVSFFTLFALKLSRRFLGASWGSFLFGLGAAAALIANATGRHFALETRPYSLWILLTMVQVGLTIHYTLRRTPGTLIALGLVSPWLCMVASPGILQTLIVVGTIYFGTRDWKKVLWAIPAILVGGFYLTRLGPWGYDSPTFQGYLAALLPILNSAFQISSKEYFVLIPIAIGLYGLIRTRSQPGRGLILFFGAQLFLSYVLFLLCQRKHFFVTPRQYVYLIPSVTLIAAMAVATLTSFLPKPRQVLLLGVIGAAMVVWQIPPLLKPASQFATRWAKLGIYAKATAPNCQKLSDASNEQAFCVLNSECRGYDTCAGHSSMKSK